MARSWISVPVEVVQGITDRYWPRPGRIFAASRAHTFEQLSTAIDDAFARWDRAHLWAFRFPGDLRIEIRIRKANSISQERFWTHAEPG